MESNYTACELRILAHEGGYTDGIHPFDPGGCTNFGVTIADAKKFWKSSATCADVRNMPKAVGLGIIKSRYWDVLSCNSLPSGVDDAVVDYGYNSGNSRAGKVLRRLLSLSDTDWHVTAEVVAEANRRDPVVLINAICDERLKFLESLAIWPTYKNGWSTRVKEVRQFSIQLAAHGASPVSNPPPTPPPAPALPSGKGTVPPAPTAPVATGGGAITAALAAAVQWLGVHPAATVALIIVAAAIIGAIIALLHQQAAAKQDAPTPNIPPVPVKV